MNTNDKLFSFLLVEPKILKDKNKFEEIKTNKEYNMYKSLVDRYYRCLEFIKIYRDKREKQIELIKKDIKNKNKKIENYQEQINSIKKEFDISDDIMKHYVRNYTDKQNKMDTMLIFGIENDEKLVSAFQQINVMNVNILILQSQINLLEEEYADYNYSYEMLDIIEKTFYNSYGFRAKYQNGTWISEQQKFLDELELRFQLECKIAKDKRDRKDLLEDSEYEIELLEDDSDEDLQINGIDIHKVFGTKNTSIFESTEMESWADVDSLIMEWYDTLKGYSTTADMLKYEKASKIYDSVERHSSSNKILEEYRKFVEGKDNSYDDIVNLLYETGSSEIRQAFYQPISDLYEYLLEAKKSLYSKYLVGDKDYRDLTKDIERLKNALTRYNKNRALKQETYANDKEREKAKEKRKIRKEEQKKALRDIFEIIVRVEGNPKRKSASEIARKLYRIEKVEEKLKEEEYNINVEIFKNLFSYLKKDMKSAHKMFIEECKEIMDSDSSNSKKDITEIILQNIDRFTVEESLKKYTGNKMYIYRNLGIITLNFYNTDIYKYKTAVLIVDKEDVEKLVIHSSRLSWTYKNGKRCSTKEYKKKTYKGERITADNGRVNICNKILGEAEQDGFEIVTVSHKFDLRKSNLRSIEVKSRKQKFNEESYYQGKLRIEKVKEENKERDKKEDMIAENTVCMNNAENTKGAAILYFNEQDKFIEFLDKLID